MRRWKVVVTLGVIALVGFAGCLVENDADEAEDDDAGMEGNDDATYGGEDHNNTAVPPSP